MKTVQRNISLSEDLESFALAEAAEQGYGSISAFFADILRQRRQAKIDADVAFLGKAMQAAPSGPEPMEEIVAGQKKVRQQMMKEGWTP